jgi:hypothetical protein
MLNDIEQLEKRITILVASNNKLRTECQEEKIKNVSMSLTTKTKIQKILLNKKKISKLSSYYKIYHSYIESNKNKEIVNMLNEITKKLLKNSDKTYDDIDELIFKSEEDKMLVDPLDDDTKEIDINDFYNNL